MARILVVEYLDSLRDNLAGLFRDRGYEVQVAESVVMISPVEIGWADVVIIGGSGDDDWTIASQIQEAGGKVIMYVVCDRRPEYLDVANFVDKVSPGSVDVLLSLVADLTKSPS